MKNLILLLLTVLTVNAFGQTYSKKYSDLNYADDGKGYHTLDIYLPKTEKDSYPVIVYIYGSAWYSNNGKGADMNSIGSALLDAGYAVVTPNHRSSGDTLFPGQIHDIKAVVRYVRGNCEAYKFDTSFIGISGSSSGGHLSAMAGTTVSVGDYTIDSVTMNLEGKLGKYTNQSSEVDAVCDWFGPTDLLVIDSCRGSSFGAPGQTPEEAMIGIAKTVNTTKFKFANPISFVDKNDPPFLIFHGDADNVVPHCEGELLHEALKAAGAKSEFYLIPGGAHYTGVHTATNIKKMVDFFNSVSGNGTSGKETISNDKSKKKITKLYPNPADKRIFAEGFNKSFKSEIEIVDFFGRPVMKSIVTDNSVDISSLKKGYYFLKTESKESGEVQLTGFVKK
jgi:acetyl esterase/lipase